MGLEPGAIAAEPATHQRHARHPDRVDVGVALDRLTDPGQRSRSVDRGPLLDGGLHGQRPIGGSDELERPGRGVPRSLRGPEAHQQLELRAAERRAASQQLVLHRRDRVGPERGQQLREPARAREGVGIRDHRLERAVGRARLRLAGGARCGSGLGLRRAALASEHTRERDHRAHTSRQQARRFHRGPE